ncbi:hypothetical protein, variant 1 [Verruconis gallopava]|uniref:Xylanolytic transcriptional activator regulatory domain-containing protein n=1 Tax=Verruconis gallopava TaxID=253628 RepID=A0A0D1XQY1_9PEZI|nr:hypothetical protein, variant 1 [Verruconis gallopava]KIW05071.1 hypothetical protein, variant 1 [Verruconis gallopava]
MLEKTDNVKPLSTVHAVDATAQSIKYTTFSKNIIKPETPQILTDHQHQSVECPTTYVDMVLRGYRSSSRGSTEASLVKSHNIYVGSSGLAFFSESRIDSITARLGHNRFQQAMENISNCVKSFIEPIHPPGSLDGESKETTDFVKLSPELANSYIEAFFKSAHPSYPFLDRRQFETNIFEHGAESIFDTSPSLFALYYAVLAIGCQYEGGDSFKLENCLAQKLFRVSLTCLPRIVMRTEGLLSLQALVAMAVFAQSVSCIRYGNMLITEAARMAVYLRYNRPVRNGEDAAQCARAFWLVYILEKLSSFVCYRASILDDEDIGIAFPGSLDPLCGGFDYFLAMARFARLLSITYGSLFTISATTLSHETIHGAIDKLIEEVEGWKSTLPRLFNPDYPFRPMDFNNSLCLNASLRLRYRYYSIVMALSRLGSLTYTSKQQRLAKYRSLACDSARNVIELTTHIDIHPTMPNWYLVVMPISACFVLFDFVINNPAHAETGKFLSLLGIVAGYFNRLEFCTDGVVRSTAAAEIAEMARQFIAGKENRAEPSMMQASDGLQERTKSGVSKDQDEFWDAVDNPMSELDLSSSSYIDFFQGSDLNSFWEILW